jgi:hypothetical protein
MLRSLTAAFALAASFWTVLGHAQTKPIVVAPVTKGLESFLFVGNSFFYFNNGLPAYVSKLAAAAPEPDKPKFNFILVTIGGAGLDWHDMESYFRPHAIGSYTIDADNGVVFNDRKKYFDAVVMMDCGLCPIHPKLKPAFVESARKDAKIARRHGAEPILFMTWAFQNKPEMTAQLADAYTKAGNENNELVIPAGLAFARVVAERPDIPLYQPDKRHPTLLGSYLAAATAYAAIYQRSPEDSSYTADIDPELARYLRKAAWRTAQEYYGASKQHAEIQ